MARLMLPLAALVALAPFASAGISFTSPTAGATFPAGKTLTIEWKEGGDGPKLTDLLTYELAVCAGGNEVGTFIPLHTITAVGQFAVSSNAAGLIEAGLGESVKNAYFLKITAVPKTGGQYIAYSDRFSFSGMTGTLAPDVKKAAAAVSGTQGPKAEDTTVKPGADPAGAAPEAGDYDVEYTMQTGLTRYAPMQPVPLTKITAKGTPPPMFPTSSVVIAKTRLPIPKVQTTVTQSQTYSVSSRENTVAAAPHATDDMAKFLNRWKD